MTLRLRPMDDRLEAVVSIDGSRTDVATSRRGAEPFLASPVRRSSTPLSLEGDDAGPAIHLTKRTLEPSRTA